MPRRWFQGVHVYLRGRRGCRVPRVTPEMPRTPRHRLGNEDDVRVPDARPRAAAPAVAQRRVRVGGEGWRARMGGMAHVGRVGTHRGDGGVHDGTRV